METKKRLVDVHELIEAGQNGNMGDIFPDWGEMKPEVQEAVCKHAQYLKILIKRLPAVDAAPVVHGRWGLSRENEISKTVWCSACGEGFYIRKKGELQIDKMHYCPNCGAKMDG